MSELKLNKRLLRKVRNRIAKIPESYDQGGWCDPSDEAPCGTTACLAGEAIIVAAPSVTQGIQDLKRTTRRYTESNKSDVGVVRKARLLLGITKEESDAMFDGFGEGWPEPYASQFAKQKSNGARAGIAIAYLDECLKRGKVIW